jgi:DNA-binding HxlR family transcriptional regulator
VGDKWTLLIVRDLLSGPRRFVELQRVLPGISTEQLRSRLNRMVADGMLTRKRYREVPPRVDYELTERARELAPVIGELSRWGYEWAWGAPRPTELVDITAIFRVLPGLINTNGTARGTVLLTVTDGHGEGPAHTVLMLAPDGATVSEPGEPRRADAVISGTTAAWVQALEPLGNFTGLARSGSEDLAQRVLELVALGRGAQQPLAAAETA